MTAASARRSRLPRPWLGLALASQLLGCAALGPEVARSVDGVTTEGRFIEPDAYALYAIAAAREARGEWRAALDLYQRALELDPRGPEIRTRIAAVACKLRQKALADRSFAAALAQGAEYGPAWFELSRCRKARGELEQAERAALRALELDPERYETSLLAAELAAERGDHESAWRLRDALSTHAPRSLQVQRSLLDAARRAGDRARAERAARALSSLNRPVGGGAAPRGLSAALEALARGDAVFAGSEAERVLGADPSNGDALVIALSAADLLQDHARFARLLASASEPGKPITPDVLGALEALLARRVSAQAARSVREQ